MPKHGNGAAAWYTERRPTECLAPSDGRPGRLQSDAHRHSGRTSVPGRALQLVLQGRCQLGATQQRCSTLTETSDRITGEADTSPGFDWRPGLKSDRRQHPVKRLVVALSNTTPHWPQYSPHGSQNSTALPCRSDCPVANIQRPMSTLPTTDIENQHRLALPILLPRSQSNRRCIASSDGAHKPQQMQLISNALPCRSCCLIIHSAFSAAITTGSAFCSKRNHSLALPILLPQ